MSIHTSACDPLPPALTGGFPVAQWPGCDTGHLVQAHAISLEGSATGMCHTVGPLITVALRILFQGTSQLVPWKHRNSESRPHCTTISGLAARTGEGVRQSTSYGLQTNSWNTRVFGRPRHKGRRPRGPQNSGAHRRHHAVPRGGRGLALQSPSIL